jgi:DNA-damage-inducible protein J
MSEETVTIRARIDARVEAGARAVLDAMGMSMDEAIGLYLGQVARQGMLPIHGWKVNAETEEAMRESEEGRGTRYKDFDEFYRAMMGEVRLGVGRPDGGSDFGRLPGA